jgi:hypothetical protein
MMTSSKTAKFIVTILAFVGMKVGLLALPLNDLDSPFASKVNRDFSGWCQVGKHHFTFEKTTLADILSAFGEGKIVRDGTPGAAIWDWFLRYRWNNQIVTFSSNSDMGSPSHDLEEVEINPAGSSEEFKLPTIKGDITFPFGGPGMSFQTLQRRLGKASVIKGYAAYQYPGHQRGDYNGKSVEYDESGWLRVKVSKDSVEQIEVGRVTSY